MRRAERRGFEEPQGSETRMLRRPQFALLVSSLAAASMLLYAHWVLIPQQKQEALMTQIPRGNLSDLYPRWLGTRELLLRGRDPYAADITREIQIGYYGRPLDPARLNDPKDQQAFAYPLYVAILLAPTVRLPFVAVRQIFLWLLVLLTGASVLWWLRALGWRTSLSARLTWIVLALGSFPGIQGFKLQQLTLLVAALLAASMAAISGRRFVWAGVLLALATIKPQLALLPIVWLGIWVLGNWRERKRLFWSFAVAMSGLVVGGEILLPGWIREFRAASAAYYRYTGGGRSVLDVLLTPTWGRVVAAIVVGAVFILVWKIRRADANTADFQWSLALVMATTLVVIPMFAPYNQLLLIPALMVIVRSVKILWSRDRMLRVLLAVSGVSVFWPWIAAGALAATLLVLPAPVVWKAWALPLYTSLAIPVTILATLLAARAILVAVTPEISQ